MRIGDMQVDIIVDGEIVTPGNFYGQEEGAHHADDIAPDGSLHLPISCFLVRTGSYTALIDAGYGEQHFSGEFEIRGRNGKITMTGGGLPAALAGLGVKPEDVDQVFVSHCHHDHVGWIVPDGEPFFTNATIRFGAGDWEPWVVKSDHPAFKAGMEALNARGRVQLIEEDGAVLPGINALGTPGHTPGHHTYLLSGGDQRLLILGDAVNCPLQIEFPEVESIADTDKQLGAATREKILREVEGSNTLVSGPHFPGLRFGRVLMGEGRRYWS